MPGRFLLGMALLLLLAAAAYGSEAIDPYAVEPVPMTVLECGRCHPGQYGSLREVGGRHRFDCRDCHELFHAYNPRKNNFAELMPDCGMCHSQPHGPKQTGCLGCHQDPHAPRTKLSMEKLAGNCGDCHTGPAAQLRDFPSAHTEQACQDCHSERHGRIPACSECHDPHFPEQAPATCRECHPVHKPLQIAFSSDVQAGACEGCHDEVTANWRNTRSRHGQVNCTDCHTRHGYLPSCTDCHEVPHSQQMLQRFTDCLGCHLDPHNMPVK